MKIVLIKQVSLLIITFVWNITNKIISYVTVFETKEVFCFVLF